MIIIIDENRRQQPFPKNVQVDAFSFVAKLLLAWKHDTPDLQVAENNYLMRFIDLWAAFDTEATTT